MRFDDSFDTVLAADLSSAFGKRAAWRQLVDLIGRGRVPADARALEQLERLRGEVPEAVRVASAEGLVYARPPAALVRFFARDSFAVAAPVLRTARLSVAEWCALLPELTPATRSILRNRRDLGEEVERALASFGPADLVLTDDSRREHGVSEGGAAGAEPQPAPAEPLRVPGGGESPFISFASAAREIPIVASALQASNDSRGAAGRAEGEGGGPFRIADVVARIDAFRQRRASAPAAAEAAAPQPRSEGFGFETDAAGVIRWVDGASRNALIGISLAEGAADGVGVDGAAAGAFRRRGVMMGVRLTVGGSSDAAGDWRINAAPAFDPDTGRFIGYRGAARRPRADEQSVLSAEPQRARADSLRQLVHELRTPINAIAGFAEMIDLQMLGPVPQVYRERAALIREQAARLLGAVEDLDLAARLDSRTLALDREASVMLRPLLDRVVAELGPLAELRGADILLPVTGAVVRGDPRALERLLSRLFAVLLSAAGEGETIAASVREQDGQVVLLVQRPVALAAYPDDAMLAIDDEASDASLLGAGFAMRLVRRLAQELGGALDFEDAFLTLRLPIALEAGMGQVHSS